MTNLQLQEELKAIFSVNPVAQDFVNLWNEYVHALDDVIDEPSNSEHTLRTFSLAQRVYSHKFYVDNWPHLLMVTVILDNTYADSVLWEHSDEEWKRQHADSMRHCGYDLFYAVVYIIAGRETLRRISPWFREYSHRKHLADIIQWLSYKDTKAA